MKRHPIVEEAASEGLRMWPEDDPKMRRWDGITITAERSYLVQRHAFEMGAAWVLERLGLTEQTTEESK